MKTAARLGLCFLLVYSALPGLHAAVSVYLPEREIVAVRNSDTLLQCFFIVTTGHIDPSQLKITWSQYGFPMAMFEGLQNTDRKDATMFREEVLKGNASLLLQKIVKRDEGPYECEVEHKGQVDSATVVLHIQVPPEVSMSPESVHLLADNTVTCSARSFYPELITFIWKRSGKAAETQQHTEPQMNPDGTFNSESVYRFTPTSHDDLTCEVHHVALKEPLRRSVTYKGLTVAGVGAIVATVLILLFIVLLYFWFSSVYLSPLHPSKLLQDESVSVQCTITSWNPEMIKLSWFINNRKIKLDRKDGDVKDEASVPLQDPSNYTLHTGSSEKGFGPKETPVTLKFRVYRSDHQGAELKCQATHLLTRRRVERSVTLEDTPIRPRLSEIENVSQNSDTDVKLQIRAEEFKPRDISFTWSLAGGTVTSDSLDITENPNGTFSAVSVCPVPLSVIQTPGFKVSVITKHISQREVERRVTCDTPGIDGRPHLSDVEMVRFTKEGEPCTLSCTITKFFPSDIKVTWLRVGAESGHQPVTAGSAEWPAKVMIPSPEMKNYTYEVTSEVQFTPKIRSEVEEMTYICRVAHVTLMEKTKEKKSGRLELTADKTRPTISDMHARFTKFGEPCTLACTVSEFYPKKINVTWDRKTKKGMKKTLPEESGDWKLNTTNYGPIMTNNRYSLVSHATFTPQSLGDLEDMDFFCTVEHESLKERMEKICSVTSGLQCCPVVSNVKLCNFNGIKQMCTLRCSIDNFFPKEIKVTWLEVGKKGKKEMKTKKASPVSEGKTYKMVSEAEFTPKDLMDLEEDKYICVVEHQTLKEPFERRSGNLVEESLFHPPIMSDIQVAEFKGLGQPCTLSCSIKDFLPKDIEVTWLLAGGDGLRDIRPMTSDPVMEEKGYRLESKAVFTPTTLRDTEETIYTCSVRHKKLQEPIRKQIKRIPIPGHECSPTVSEIQVHFTELNQPCFLSCFISEFYPQELDVSWQWESKKNKKLLPAGDGKWKPELKQYGPLIRYNKFELVSQAVFTPFSEADLEDQKFVCIVKQQEKGAKPIMKRCSVPLRTQPANGP
ncbi:uncharacterized protein LOC120536432 [Polypterus senegalus]|uniref:uncharacterized protein LOC120536432 n=1 Tax=Polypterus senegalus TaxID=55291 RepID=UPI00196230C9|nr:uncharacterized protein LOC120536432 [Polypterus senegalus]